MSQEMYTGEEIINWDVVSDEAPPPLENGLYFATFSKADFQKTKAGKPGAKLELSVSKAYGGEDGALKRKLFDNPVFSIESAFRVKQLAKAAGVDLPSPINLETIEEFCGRLLSSGGVWLRVKQDTYQDKVSAKIDRYFTEAQVAEAASGKAPTAEAPAASGGRASRRKA